MQEAERFLRDGVPGFMLPYRHEKERKDIKSQQYGCLNSIERGNFLCPISN